MRGCNTQLSHTQCVNFHRGKCQERQASRMYFAFCGKIIFLTEQTIANMKCFGVASNKHNHISLYIWKTCIFSHRQVNPSLKLTTLCNWILHFLRNTPVYVSRAEVEQMNSYRFLGINITDNLIT